MGTTPPAIQTVTHVSVRIQGTSISGVDPSSMNNLLFSSCTPPNWSIDAPKHIFHGNQGAPEPIIAGVQNPTYGTMTLSQGWDPGHVLASWMNKISDPSVAITDKKATVTVVFMDSTGNALFQWVGTGALLTSFTHSASDASSNGVLTITATIDADTWQLQGSGGGSAL
ncbi:MAG: phage tail protein [Solirubrobacteraceae bacterium]